MAIEPGDVSDFIDAQESVWELACVELANERKKSHWIWWIFPQHAGLGRSSTSVDWGLSSTATAEAYLQNAVLGDRLRYCCDLLLHLPLGMDIVDIMGGSVDAMKVRSCMTIFDMVAPDDVFRDVLSRYFAGNPDNATMSLVDPARSVRRSRIAEEKLRRAAESGGR